MGGFNMNRININLNSSAESMELVDGSAVRLETEPQFCRVIPHSQENHTKHILLFNSELQTITIDIKFRSDHLLHSHISEGERILLEIEWTDILVKILEYGNDHVLLSHKYRIEMEN
jgi:hypothetical protein